MSIQDSLKRFTEEFGQFTSKDNAAPKSNMGRRKSMGTNTSFNTQMDGFMSEVEIAAKSVRKDLSAKFKHLRKQLNAIESVKVDEKTNMMESSSNNKDNNELIENSFASTDTDEEDEQEYYSCSEDDNE
jgi:hypothetical protein